MKTACCSGEKVNFGDESEGERQSNHHPWYPSTHEGSARIFMTSTSSWTYPKAVNRQVLPISTEGGTPRSTCFQLYPTRSDSQGGILAAAPSLPEGDRWREHHTSRFHPRRGRRSSHRSPLCSCRHVVCVARRGVLEFKQREAEEKPRGEGGTELQTARCPRTNRGATRGPGGGSRSKWSSAPKSQEVKDGMQQDVIGYRR